MASTVMDGYDQYLESRNRGKWGDFVTNPNAPLTASEFYEYVTLTEIIDNLGRCGIYAFFDDEFDGPLVKRWSELWSRL